LFRNDIFNTSHITDEKSLAGKRRFRFVGMKLILQGEGPKSGETILPRNEQCYNICCGTLLGYVHLDFFKQMSMI
jgi:hypothetical protein